MRDKLILMLIVSVFIPIMIVGVFLTYELRENAILDAVDQSITNVERVKKRTAEVLKVPIYISDGLQFDQQLSTLANTEFKSTYEVVNAYRNYDKFSYYLQYYPEIEKIRFYMDNPTLIDNWDFIPVDSETKKRQWYHEAEKEAGYIRWFYAQDETKKDQPFLSLVRRINFLDYSTFGMLVITINPSQLNWILNQEAFLTMLIDDNNTVVASNQKNKIGKQFNHMIDNMKKKENSIYEGVLEGEPSQIIMEELFPEQSQNQLKIVSISANKLIVKDANSLSLFGISVTIAGFIAAMLIIILVSNLFTKRLSNLGTQIKNVSKGDLNTQIVIDGNDEIGQLSHQFNEMVANLRQLIDQVHETNRQKNILQVSQNESKLKMMASQINPHFLFNTLESIRMKAHIEGVNEVADVVKRLGKLMRKSLEVGRSKIPLWDEIETVRCYLEIQQFRYKERLEYELDIDPDSRNILVNPLTIQPLVENAVIHGLDNKEAGGKVVVQTKVSGHYLQVTVTDNGIGIEDKRLKEILQFINEEDEGIRIGLRNVHQRQVLTYGKGCGLQITSKKGTGTCIQFMIPLEEEVGCLK